MYKPSKRIVIAVLVLGLAGFAFGVWVLLNPASIFVQPWRAVRAEAPVKGVLLGPYPVEEDFADLKKRGVTTIISLLEPNVPYEKKPRRCRGVACAADGCDYSGLSPNL